MRQNVPSTCKDVHLQIEAREVINRPRDVVFSTLSQPELFLSTWAKGVVSVSREVEGQDQLPRYKVIGRDLVGKVVLSYQVLNVRPCEYFEGRATGGPVDFTERFDLVALSDSATEVCLTQHLRPTGIFLLAGRAINLVWPSLMKKNLSSLKSTLERTPTKKRTRPRLLRRLFPV